MSDLNDSSASSSPESVEPTSTPSTESSHRGWWDQQAAEIGEQVQQISHVSEQWIQQWLAETQLGWGGTVRDCAEGLKLKLATITVSQSLEALEAEVHQVAQVLTPTQIEVLIKAIPVAAHRALLASLFYQDAILSKTGSDLQAISARAYGLSGFPMVLNPEGQVQIDASAALISALVAVEVTQATISVAWRLLGSSILEKLLKTDESLRRSSLKQGALALPDTEDWESLQSLLLSGSSDWYLSLTTAGIQGSQITEFVGRQLRSIVRNQWLQRLVPLPFSLILDAIDLLTDDVFFHFGNTLESSWDREHTIRRLELALQALPNAQRIPKPSQLITASSQVSEATDQILKPLLAKQLHTACEGFDPQHRNEILNQLGQQLNQWNPFQFFQGWVSIEWIETTLESTEILWEDYPTLTCLQLCVAGLQEARQYERAMDQAQVLRHLVKELDPTRLDGSN